MSHLYTRVTTATLLGATLLAVVAQVAFSQLSHAQAQTHARAQVHRHSHTRRHTRRAHHHKSQPRRPGPVRELRVLDQTSGQVSIGWRRARRGSVPLDGYRVTRDGLVLGQTRRLSYAVRVGPGTHRITVTAVDLDGHLGPTSSPLSITIPTSPGPSGTAPRTPSVPRAPGAAPPIPHTTPILPSAIPPSTPGGLRASEVGYDSAVVEWGASTAVGGEAVRYRVFRNGTTVAQTQGLSMTLEHLAPETGYTITVVAVDSLGATSAPSAALEIETATPTPPATPSEPKASEVGDESAKLEWGASTPGSGEITGYRVFRDGTSVGQTQGLSMTLEHLAPETGYTITVVAVDSLGGVSAPSAALEIRTAPPPQSHGTAQAALLATTTLSFEDLQAHYQQIGVLYPTYFECGAGGAVTGENDPLVTSWAQERGIAVMPRLNCQNPLDEDQILNEPAVQQKLIEQLASLCETYGYQGIQVDFEGAQPAERNPFTAFITALAAKLHEHGEKLSTIVTAKYYNIMSGRAAMYDDAALSGPSDYLFVLDWGLHWTTSAPGGIDELPWFKKVAEYTATMPNKSKFVVGMPMYGIDWPNGGGPSNPGTPLEFSEITALANEYGVTPEWDAEAADPHFSYVDRGGVTHSVWYTDKQSLEARVTLAQSLGLGVGLWHLGSEDQTIWELPGLGG
jgi:spore germination protein YaaH